MKVNQKSGNLLLLLLSFSSIVFAQQQSSICLEMKYTFTRNGFVESQTSRNYDEKGNLIYEKEVVTSKFRGDFTNELSYSYDLLGNQVSMIEKRNGNIVRKINSEKTGNISKNTETSNNKNFSSILKTENSSEQIFYEADGITEGLREKKTFDSKGNVLKKEIVSKNGKATMIEEKSFDSKGNILKYTNNDVVGNVIHITDYVYDSDGKILVDKTFRNEKLFSQTNYEYNQNGHLIKKVRLNSQGIEDYFHTFEYDSKGKLIKDSFYYNKIVVNYSTFEYDSKGNKIKESIFDNFGKIQSQKDWEFACR